MQKAFSPLVRLAYSSSLALVLPGVPTSEVIVQFSQGGIGGAVARSKAIKNNRDILVELLEHLCVPDVFLQLRAYPFARSHGLEEHVAVHLVDLLEREKLLRSPLTSYSALHTRVQQLRRFHPLMGPESIAPYYFFLSCGSGSEMEAQGRKIKEALDALEGQADWLTKRLSAAEHAACKRLVAGLGFSRDLRFLLLQEINSNPPGPDALKRTLRGYERCFERHRRLLTDFHRAKAFSRD